MISRMLKVLRLRLMKLTMKTMTMGMVVEMVEVVGGKLQKGMG